MCKYVSVTACMRPATMTIDQTDELINRDVAVKLRYIHIHVSASYST
jgi:hypothetical protein